MFDSGKKAMSNPTLSCGSSRRRRPGNLCLRLTATPGSAKGLTTAGQRRRRRRRAAEWRGFVDVTGAEAAEQRSSPEGGGVFVPEESVEDDG